MATTKFNGSGQHIEMDVSRFLTGIYFIDVVMENRIVQRSREIIVR
jgi:hypothetical protein